MQQRWIRYGARVTLSLALATPLASRAGCARPLLVPVAPIGMSVIVNGNSPSGIYPELLTRVSARTGCLFTLSVVPRARLEALFEAGSADLLMPATRTARRDEAGYFVPLIASRAALLSFDNKRAPVRSLQELVERRELRLALVRGFDYGAPYQSLIKQLSAQGRVFMEVDPVAVARLMGAGLADATLMSPIILAGAVQGDARVEALLAKLRIETFDELSWGESGIYLSKTGVSTPDRATLERALQAAVKSGEVWDSFKRYYPPEILNAGARPLVAGAH